HLRRKIELKENRKVAQVSDEIETTKPSVVWWFAHTKAEIALASDHRSALLSRPEGDLRAEIVSPSEASFLIMPAAPLPGSPNPDIQNKNIGIRKLAVVLSNVGKTQLAVRFIPGEARVRKSTIVSLGENLKPLPEKAIFIEAEDFSGQSGGKVDVTVKISNSGKSFKGWDATGHAISWKIKVPETGTYGLLVRYCTQEDFTLRTLRIDEQSPAGDEVFSFPSTGGYSSSVDNWREAWFAGKNGGLRLKLSSGAHTFTLVNAGAPMNLDWLKIVPLRD
ncbi:MAG: carbohydrate-binding protein, partial [Spirochaetia bacterium]|nr:carbohydrate-binding protein [Spirochaetia bacterium]